MKLKPTIPHTRPTEFHIMGLADRLSDEPLLLLMFGGSFKVIVDFDIARKRVTYSFRSRDDVSEDDLGIQDA